MILVKRLLDPETLKRVQDAYATLDFVDGVITAGRNAGSKHNYQAAPNSASTVQLVQQLSKYILANYDIQRSFWPRKLSNITFNKFCEGDFYGRHIDNVLQNKPPVRTDLSVSVWLNSPEDYEGGELAVYDGDMASGWKGEAGDAIFYPSTLFHEIAPVTRGERHAAFFWIESRVKDHEERAMLYDLYRTIRRLDDDRHSEVINAMRVYYGLIRKWLD